eukprot:TRINITY_DN72711_c0_g1_i1.p2 TRINITY_DN72711_c0_g1~~TRINITY_DN72711_c0_g1_i1.p2  ORF type:complete len:401 (+),score=34.18 TRINITY_DN72711_c0_g1_i1:90-1205(+)
MEKHERVYNFSPGPACLPLLVLEKAKKELLNYNETGMSVMELSHRGKHFQKIWNNTRYGFRKLLDIPETHEVLLVPDDASIQFATIPMNFLAGKSLANYMVTGHWSKAAISEAERYCKVNSVWPDPPDIINSIPPHEKWHVDPNGAYFHYCSNETVDGLTLYEFPYKVLPENMPLICDMSSEFCARKIDVDKFGVIYAGVQKNCGPAGVTVLIVRKKLLDKTKVLPITPSVYNYALIQECPEQMYNTPATWSCYVTGLYLEYMNSFGLKHFEDLAIEKSKLLYTLIDKSDGYYVNKVAPEFRSRTNVCFHLSKGEEATAKFVEKAEKEGLVGLEGYKLVGGIRASLYNAMPMEGAEKLIEFMKQFMDENKQ